jgi:hypothetical protein
MAQTRFEQAAIIRGKRAGHGRGSIGIEPEIQNSSPRIGIVDDMMAILPDCDLLGGPFKAKFPAMGFD